MDSRSGWLVISWFLVMIFYTSNSCNLAALFKLYQEIRVSITLWAGGLFSRWLCIQHFDLVLSISSCFNDFLLQDCFLEGGSDKFQFVIFPSI